jgi:hypothetical protein
MRFSANCGEIEICDNGFILAFSEDAGDYLYKVKGWAKRSF